MKLTTEQIREKFFKMYEDEWDFSHQNIEKGDEYYYFLRDNNLLDQYKDTYLPIHISQVPNELRERYKGYIKKDLIESFCYPEDEEEFKAAYTLDNMIEEFAENLGYLEEEE